MVRKDLVKDQKWLEKIQIKNDVVFCTVFLDEEDCRELLQRLMMVCRCERFDMRSITAFRL